MKFKALSSLVWAMILAGSGIVQAQESPLPRIKRLGPSDIVFSQIQDAVAQGYMAENSGYEPPDLFLASWVATAGEDLFSLAARLSLPYEAIATLNGISGPRTFRPGELVLIPSTAGLFVAEQPRYDLDLLLASRIGGEPWDTVPAADKGGRDLRFYPGKRLSGTERSFFLNVGFRIPLPSGMLTSSFGMRRSPIDGVHRKHQGVDLSAPSGTEVLASMSGTVADVSEDSVLGKYVVLAHDGGLQTVYGHLSATLVMLNQSVQSGTIIGRVGSTGLSTGPHLHFEIRVGGSARDPARYLNGLSQ